MTANTPSFPSIVPTGRQFDAGQFPVKTYAAQNGAEIRLLYGNKRVGMTMQLTYTNIPDSQAKLFIEHYHAMKGSYTLFSIGTASRDGWSEDDKYLGASGWGSSWRYENPPQLTSVYPGVSSVSVNLKAATT